MIKQDAVENRKIAEQNNIETMCSILYTQDIRQENLQLAQKIARH